MAEIRPWLATHSLFFAYGSRPVVRDVDLAFYPGRHYVLAGPNGAGKSTLLDLLARLKRPAGGTVEVMHRKSSGYAPGDLARILALAPQEYRLDFSFTIREVVAMGRRPFLDRWGRLSAEDYAIVDSAIAALHLSELANRPVTALSGGERRRCIVARALAQSTPILLLDEPTAGLDVAQALAVMALARSRADEGALVVTVTHDLNLAAAYAHEMVFLKEGTVRVAGPMEEVFTDDTLSAIYDTEAQVRRDRPHSPPFVTFRLTDDV